MRQLGFAWLAACAALGCGAAGRQTPHKPGDPGATATSCDAFVDTNVRARLQNDVLATWHLDNGAPGYEHEVLLQVDKSGTASFVNIDAHSPGKPRQCGTKKLSAKELEALEATLAAHDLCAQKPNKRDPDIPVHELDVHLGKIACKVYLDYQKTDQSPEARAAFEAFEAMIPAGLHW